MALLTFCGRTGWNLGLGRGRQGQGQGQENGHPSFPSVPLNACGGLPWCVYSPYHASLYTFTRVCLWTGGWCWPSPSAILPSSLPTPIPTTTLPKTCFACCSEKPPCVSSYCTLLYLPTASQHYYPHWRFRWCALVCQRRGGGDTSLTATAIPPATPLTIAPPTPRYLYCHAYHLLVVDRISRARSSRSITPAYADTAQPGGFTPLPYAGSQRFFTLQLPLLARSDVSPCIVPSTTTSAARFGLPYPSVRLPPRPAAAFTALFWVCVLTADVVVFDGRAFVVAYRFCVLTALAWRVRTMVARTHARTLRFYARDVNAHAAQRAPRVLFTAPFTSTCSVVVHYTVDARQHTPYGSAYARLMPASRHVPRAGTYRAGYANRHAVLRTFIWTWNTLLPFV